MKATGIVRRIDDLGRVVIPKEIRRTMRIREGDPLEIYTNSGGEVIFKKYSPVGELSSFASEYAEALTQGTGLGVLICDRDHFIAAAGVPKRDIIEKGVSSELESIMESRRTSVFDSDSRPFAADGFDKKICVAAPIIAAGDIAGAVVLVENGNQTTAQETDTSLAGVAARFLGTQME